MLSGISDADWLGTASEEWEGGQMEYIVEITIVDDEYAVMPDGDEPDRVESLARYHEIAERDLARAFPGAIVNLSWGRAFKVESNVANAETADEIERDVQTVLQRVFESGGW